MMRGWMRFVFVAICLGSAGSANGSEPILERQWWQRTDLSEHIGQTYLQTYLKKIVGIHAEIAEDYDRAVTIADVKTVEAAIRSFDPRISERTFRNFTEGEIGFGNVVAGVAGQSFETRDYRAALTPFVDAHANVDNQEFALSVAQALTLLTSGSGTLVRLDEHNYFYNVGYQDPIQVSGRSYGVSKDRKLLDPSDRDFLKELDAYMGAGNLDPSPFYTVMFEILTNSDPRGIASLSEDGQTLMTDFMTIYTAELNRNHMADLSPTKWAWQSDLAEVVLLAAYGGASGMAVIKGELIKCNSLAYDWRHGIGPRSGFMAMSRLITQYQIDHNPELVFSIVALTPLTDVEVIAFVQGDIFRRVLTFLNRSETQLAATENAVALTSAMVALLRQVRADHQDITRYAETTMPSSDTPCAELQ